MYKTSGGGGEFGSGGGLSNDLPSGILSKSIYLFMTSRSFMFGSSFILKIACIFARRSCSDDMLGSATGKTP